ncbi:MAG TPA: LytTR family DNA-binding domain-containing protein [Anditalea sp.]|nr:LytTR family DNA-binding domain-containing protein [Anditalea sp.]
MIIIIGIFNTRVNEDRWVVMHEIILIGFLLLIIGISQFLIRDFIYNNPENWSIKYFFEEIRNTTLSGFLFVCILVPLNFMRLNKLNKDKAKQIHHISLNNNQTAPKYCGILTQQKSDDFDLDLQNFLFAKSEGNYLEFYITEDQNIVKKLKRMTLSELESQLQQFPNIFKTHRSYLVNLLKITSVNGNAQGYQLEIKKHTLSIPVSRKIIPAFENRYDNI